MKVLQAVHPLVVVDESHNATSKLSEQMLNDLQPSLVIDLTATPRENSNIICFTDALELKRNNMVKLPVIVYNHTSKRHRSLTQHCTCSGGLSRLAKRNQRQVYQAYSSVSGRVETPRRRRQRNL